MTAPAHVAALQSITIRAVRDEDGLAVAALIMACFAEYDGCLFSWEEFPELRAPAVWAASRGTSMWVAEDVAGAIVGCVCATPEHGKVELHKFYVAEPMRGSGLAVQLADRLLQLAREGQAEEVFLWTDSRFTRAHRFYEKLGFVRLAETRLLHDISNTTEFHYRLCLP